MTAGGRCTVVCDVPGRPLLLEVELPAGGATIAAVLALARGQPAAQAADVAWDRAPTGIWGCERPRTALVRSGDRVEVYRRLPRDPRVARRARAAAVRRRAR